MLNPSKRRSRRVFVFIHTPGSLTGICAVDVTQLAEAEAITSRWVDITIHSHYRTAGGHLEHLPHLNVHFKVGDRAPKLWSCNENSKLCEALTVNKTVFSAFRSQTHTDRYWRRKLRIVLSRACRVCLSPHRICIQGRIAHSRCVVVVKKQTQVLVGFL